MAGYKVKVIIPVNFIMVHLSMRGEIDLYQYEDCLAFALSNRWDLADLDFQISQEAVEHSFTFEPDYLIDYPRKPDAEGFSIAIDEAMVHYRMMKEGIFSLDSVSRNSWFAPPDDKKIDDIGREVD